MRAIAIDFETANERRDSACAVGLAWIEDGRIVRRESRLIRPPEMRFAPGNIRIHGIRPADVRHCPSCAEVMRPFLPDLADRIVLAHNAGFDMGVLRDSLAACAAPVPDLSYLCTVRTARRVFPDPAGCGLGKVAARLGIAFDHHDAGEDAYACAEIALAAVRETGAADMADLAGRLGLSLGRLTQSFLPASKPPRSIAARALAALRHPLPPSPSAALTFLVRGRSGNHYRLVLQERAFGLTLRCSCLAGAHDRLCRHVEALVDGDVTDLISDNLSDVERLRDRIWAAGGALGPRRPQRGAAA